MSTDGSSKKEFNLDNTYDLYLSACDGDLQTLQELLLNSDTGRNMLYTERMPLLEKTMQARLEKGEIAQEDFDKVRGLIKKLLGTL